MANRDGLRAKRHPGSGRGNTARGSDRSGSLVAAQQRWPEYNRAIFLGTAIAILLLFLFAAVMEVLHS